MNVDILIDYSGHLNGTSENVCSEIPLLGGARGGFLQVLLIPIP